MSEFYTDFLKIAVKETWNKDQVCFLGNLLKCQAFFLLLFYGEN